MPPGQTETPDKVKEYYLKGEGPPTEIDAVPKRTNIAILFQGFTCASARFSKSLGVRPDRGEVTLAKEEVGAVAFAAEAIEKAERPLSGTLQGQFSTTARLVGEAAVKGVGFGLPGYLHLRSPYGSFSYGPLFVDLQGIKEIQESEKREGLEIGQPMAKEKAQASLEPPSEQSSMRVDIVDERIWWQYRGVVNGRFNITRNVEGQGLLLFGIKYERRTIRIERGRPYSLIELIQYCVANLPPREYIEEGESGKAKRLYEAPGFFDPEAGGDGVLLPPRKVIYWPKKLEQEFPIDVVWDGENAADSLAKLLGDYNLYLSLRYDGDVDIFYQDQEGAYDPAFELWNLRGDRKVGQSFNFKPPAAMVVGNPIVRETTIRDWVPVIQWGKEPSGKFREGQIVPLRVALREWAYLEGKLRMQILNNFDGKDGKMFDDMLPSSYKEERKKILKTCAFKWFQAAGWKNYVPIRKTRVVLDAKTNELYDVPLRVYGTWHEAKKEKDKFKGLFRNVLYEDAGDLLAGIDEKHLILKFKQPMGIVATNPNALEDEDLIERAKAAGKSMSAAMAEWNRLLEYDVTLQDAKLATQEIAAPPEDEPITLSPEVNKLIDEELQGIWEEKLSNEDRIARNDDLTRFIKRAKSEEVINQLARILAIQKARTKVGPALAALRKHKEGLIDDTSITALHQCRFYPPLLELSFMYDVKDDRTHNLVSALVDGLLGEWGGEPVGKFLAGQRVDHPGFEPWEIVQASNRYTFYVGEGCPEVVQSDITFYDARAWNNLESCNAKAAEMIQRRYDALGFRAMEDRVFGGFHPVPTSGLITHIAWDSQGELATTQVKYGDFVEGFGNRPGIDWKEFKRGPVTRAGAGFIRVRTEIEG